jgi:Fe-S oxidoreductase
MAAYKAEFLFQYQKDHRPRLRDRIFAYNGKMSKMLNPIRGLQNTAFQMPLLGSLIKKTLCIASARSLPKLFAPLDRQLFKKQQQKSKRQVYLYLDEFTNYLDVKAGSDAFQILTRLGYYVHVLPSTESGRAYISKGFLEQAKVCANRNVDLYKDHINTETPLLGIEPSALYTFKDEYLKLATDQSAAKKLSENCFLIEEFLAKEVDKGQISSDVFTDQTKSLKIHAHCYQKSLGNPADTFKILNLPKNYKVTLLATGCCGMAGSFGYEAEHFEISQKIGEERLFPAIRKMDSDTLLAANGTSCRHQISDGTGRVALHPISILNEALR